MIATLQEALGKPVAQQEGNGKQQQQHRDAQKECGP